MSLVYGQNIKIKGYNTITKRWKTFKAVFLGYAGTTSMMVRLGGDFRITSVSHLVEAK